MVNGNLEHKHMDAIGQFAFEGKYSRLGGLSLNAPSHTSVRFFEPALRALTPWLSTGLASDLQIAEYFAGKNPSRLLCWSLQSGELSKARHWQLEQS